MNIIDIRKTYPSDTLWQSAAIMVEVAKANGDITAAALALGMGKVFLRKYLKARLVAGKSLWTTIQEKYKNGTAPYEGRTKPISAAGRTIAERVSTMLKSNDISDGAPLKEGRVLLANVLGNNGSVEKAGRYLGVGQQTVRRMAAYCGLDIKAVLGAK